LRDSLHFDHYQFENPPNRPVNPRSRISFSDYHRMHTEHRRTNFRQKNEIPEWALNDSTIRRVVVTKLACMTGAVNVPETFEEMRALDKIAIARLAANRNPDVRRGAEVAARIGSLAALWIAVLYRSYRLGYDAVQVAADLEISPDSVRQMLWRLNHFHTRLDAGLLRRVRVGRSAKLVQRKRKFDYEQAVRMRARGLTFKVIARKLGVCQASVYVATRSKPCLLSK